MRMMGRLTIAMALTAVLLVLPVSPAGATVSDVGPRVPGLSVPAIPAPGSIMAPSAPVPDPAPAACGWVAVGYSSNCDGLDPNQLYQSNAWPTACTANNDLLMRTVESATLDDDILIQLTYAGGTDAGCRTVAASLYVPNYTGSKPCSVTITRSSDHTTATGLIARTGGFWSAETLSLYDANVSITASATCTYGGHTYTGKTAAY